MALILIIEDDPDISNLLIDHLSQQGHTAVAVADGAAGLAQGLSLAADLVLLDVMLPKLDGFSVGKKLRAEKPQLPIMFITARDDEIDRVLGIEIGGDDYVVKPFSIREVIARVNGLLRRLSRASPPGVITDSLLSFGELSIDAARRRVQLRGKEVTLTAKEFDLLFFLASHPGRPFTRQNLLERVWDYDFEGYERTVTSHMNRLRAKIETDSEHPRYLLTVRGVGYRFVELRELARP